MGVAHDRRRGPRRARDPGHASRASAAAYWLLDTLRRWLVAAGTERLQLDTLRLRLLKIGGRVRELLSRVRLHLASSHPGEPLWALLAARPGRP